MAACNVELQESFSTWLSGLDDKTRPRIVAYVQLLRDNGLDLGFPFARRIKSSKKLWELRTTIKDHEYRLLYAFDSRGIAVLIVGGDKTGEWDRWYVDNVPIAEAALALHEQQIAERKR